MELLGKRNHRRLFLILPLLLLSTACVGVLRDFYAGKGFKRNAFGEKLSLWVECQGKNHTLDTPEKIDELLGNVIEWDVSSLLVQVYRGGLAWYPSQKVEMSSSVQKGFDPLGYILEKSKESGVEIHAWVNVFNLADNRSAPILKKLGDEVLTRDNFGRATDAWKDGRAPEIIGKPGAGGEPFLIGTPGVWLDPGVASVREFQLGVIAEILEKYPSLAGVHLDFIRYPYTVPIRPVSRMGIGIDFGYAEGALEAFRNETGGEAPLANQDVSNASRWDDWRRAQVTMFVEGARALAAPSKRKLTVAALAWADRAYLSSFQDWRGWLEQGLIDAAVVMNYSRDRALARHISRAAVAAAEASPGGKSEAWIGLGAYLFGTDTTLLQDEARDARDIGAAQINLFSYDTIRESTALRETLLQRRETALERQKHEESLERLFDDGY